jgi:hypothetical protein
MIGPFQSPYTKIVVIITFNNVQLWKSYCVLLDYENLINGIDIYSSLYP